VGFVVDRMALFSEYFGFPRQFSFQQMFHAYLSFEAGTIGQLVADERSDVPSLTPHDETKKKN
jgi:hypothetical protein